ncbi:O-antigen ligase family protein [Galbitalea sp. SE-J8]|uniref:O-antigen ligase family protein n=1 Tax=Galbitalea sp. SE-J8 TaxID=3054952 RepID=UPI00259C8F1B|nr:O-antigen ligase family protein [Galbitalea sp. SE-J8]MDM4761519.1 O-antigen ligase family protein [Galbitalea sp. SE-J8]
MIELGLALPRTADGRVNGRALARRGGVVASVALALIGAVVVERADAGLRDRWLLVGIASALPLYVAGRGWRLPVWLHAIAAALPVTVLLAGLADGTDGVGLARAARYGYGAVLLLAVAAYARTPRRRLVLAAGAALVVLDQYTVGWFAWWGGGSPTKLMLGSFYWHNQFGAFCAAGVALGVFLAAFGRRVVALLGFVTAAFGIVGTLTSGSRASAAMVLVVLVIALAASALARSVHAALRLVGVAVLALGLGFVMTSTLFFPVASTPWAALTARSDDWQMVSDTGAFRLDFWWAALRIGASHPFTGVGPSQYGEHSLCYSLDAYASNPHNEWLLAWAETGVLGTVPLLGVLVGTIVLLARGARDGWRTRFAEDPGRWGALVALVLLVAHAGMDFDWAWGSLPGMAGLVGGIAAAPVVLPRAGAARRMPRLAAITAIALVVVLVAASATGLLVDPRAADPLLSGMGWFTGAVDCG